MKPFQILLIISFLLTACAPRTTAASAPPAQATVASTPLSTETPPVENTKIVPTPTEKVKTIEELAADVLAGETVDISALTLEQQAQLAQELSSHAKEMAQLYLDGEIDSSVIDSLPLALRQEFSIAYCDLKNELRGDNPVIWTDPSGKKFYIDPNTGDFLPVDNGTTAKEQTITLYLPKVVDAEGYTHIFYEGGWVKIAGSQNIKSAEDIKNGDFNWPDTEIVDLQWVTEENKHLLGLTIPEYEFKKDDGRQRTMQPIIILSKEVGGINIVGFGDAGTLIGYIINENNPFSVQTVLLTGNMALYEDNLTARSSGKITTRTPFWQELGENNLYYVMYLTDQKAAFATTYPRSNGEEVTTDYEGLAPPHLTEGIITGEKTSNDLVLITANQLVKESGN
ncbi:MAG: hypothetical protein LC099_10335 [Anaerolineales bacterium]|nr:hypothetical protein [Anaerolineales bacterium]